MIQISGRVLHGDHYGRQLGFPTANLDRRDYANQQLRVRLGVWAGTAKVESEKLKVKSYKAGIVIGPIDKTGRPKIEAHLIGFKGHLYGKKIIISLGKFVRPFKNFKNVEELKKQIEKDLRRIL